MICMPNLRVIFEEFCGKMKLNEPRKRETVKLMSCQQEKKRRKAIYPDVLQGTSNVPAPDYQLIVT